MTLTLIRLNCEIVWRVAEDDESEHPLAPLAPATLKNPKYFASEMRSELKTPACILPDGSTVFQTNALVVEWPGANHIDPHECADFVPHLIGSLRYLSGQFQLPNVVRAVVLDLQWAGRLRKPTLRAQPGAFVQRSLVGCSARFSLVPDAVQVSVSGGPPHWSTFFLDALRAHQGQDWKTALLLSALATEIGVGEALEEMLAARLKLIPRPPGVVITPVSGGDHQVSDPVYNALSERMSFRQSLHERPLYLAGKSLMLSEKSTFDSIVRLYTTRNKIAHLGAPSDSDTKTFPLTREGACTAIEASSRCLTFFGKDVRASLQQPGLTPTSICEFE